MSSKSIGPLFEVPPSTEPLRSFADLRPPHLLAQQSAKRRELVFSACESAGILEPERSTDHGGDEND